MRRLLIQLNAYAADRRAATAIEYGLIAAGIAVAIIAAVGLLGDELAGFFGDVQGELSSR